MRRLLALLVVAACLCGIPLGCGGGQPGGPTGGHIKLTDEQMQQAKEAQMKAMMQQKSGMPGGGK